MIFFEGILSKKRAEEGRKNKSTSKQKGERMENTSATSLLHDSANGSPK